MQKHRFTVKRHAVVPVKVKGGKRVGLSRDALPKSIFKNSWTRRQSGRFANLEYPFYQPNEMQDEINELKRWEFSIGTVINVDILKQYNIVIGGTYTKLLNLPADEFGRPNVNPPTVVDQDNLTLYRFTLNTDRLTAKLPPPSDYANGPLEFNVVWTNDGGVDDNGRNVRWQIQYQVGSEGDVISGNHANSPKQVDDIYASALGWVEHHSNFMQIAGIDFLNEECIYVRFMAITPVAPALTCEPHMLGVCLRYKALRIPT